MEVDEQAAGVPDGWSVVSAPKAPAPASDARPSVSARAGVPAAGRGSQINPDQSMRGLELATTPLARPTGIDAIDGLTSPVGIASVAAGGYGIARAGLAGGAAAAAREAVATGTGAAAAQAKFWATKGLLIKMGVPPTIAEGLALVASGLKKGGAKSEPVSTVPPPGVESAQEALARQVASRPTAAAPPAPAPPVAPPAAGPAAPGPQAAPGAPAVGSPPMPAAPPSGPAPMAPPPAVMTRLSPATAAAVAQPIPQKALNEIAIAARRLKVPSSPELDQAAHGLMQQGATAQEAVAALQPPSAAPAPAVATVAKPKLTGTEMAAFLKLIQQGKTPSEAYAALEAQRAFQAQFGLSTPTADQTRFQKGNRGGPR